MKRLITFLLLCSCATFALDRQPLTDYAARRHALAAKTGGGVVLLFAPTESEGPNAIYGFHQDNNFYYLTGWLEPGAAILVAPEAAGRAYTEILFLPARNVTQEKWTGPKLTADSPDAARQTGFARVEPLDKLRDILVQILPAPRALVLTDIPTEGGHTPSWTATDWLRRANAFPNYIGFDDVKPLLAEMRVIKDARELDLIRKAVAASMEAHRVAMRAARPGMPELQLSWIMQYEFGSRGCERPAYAPIVGSGFYSTVLHYSENSGTMKDGDVVVLDVAGEYSMYASDITRTLPVNGKFTARQREIYDIVLGSINAAIAAYQPGKSTLARSGAGSLYVAAMQYINTHGKDKHGQPLGQYFIHGLSHFVGLEVHDVGAINATLRPGMVFTIEPGIYIPEENLGVRIEDMIYVDENGKLVSMTASLARTADEVEKAMAARATTGR